MKWQGCRAFATINRKPAQISSNDEIHRKFAAEKLSRTGFWSKIDLLKTSLNGSIITPHDSKDYMDARTRPFNDDVRGKYHLVSTTLFNPSNVIPACVSGFPLVIVKAKNTSDVVETVNFVRNHGDGITFCVAAGGHSTRCMVSDSFVLDLALIRDVHVDNVELKVSVGGGAYLQDVDDALTPMGLGVTLGTYPWVGVGGLILSGGFGWLGRGYGFSVDHLLEVEIVLADGTIVVANDNNEHASLIWACRGGGGNFGVVTRFTLKTHRLPPHCFGGFKVFLAPTAASALKIARNYDALLASLPLSTSGGIMFPGGAPVVPTAWCHFDDSPDALKTAPVLARASKLGGWLTVEDSVKRCSYHQDVQKMTVKHTVIGPNCSTLLPVGAFDQPLPEAFFPEVIAHARRRLPRTLRSAFVMVYAMGGALLSADSDGSRTCMDAAVRRAR